MVLSAIPSTGASCFLAVETRLIGTGAFVLLSAGTLVIAIQFQDAWGGIILLPVYLYMLYLLL